MASPASMQEYANTMHNVNAGSTHVTPISSIQGVNELLQPSNEEAVCNTEIASLTHCTHRTVEPKGNLILSS